MHSNVLYLMLVVENFWLNYILWERSFCSPLARNISSFVIISVPETFDLITPRVKWASFKRWNYKSRNPIQLLIIHHKYLISNDQQFWWKILEVIRCASWKSERIASQFLPNSFNLSLINTILSHSCILKIEKGNKDASIKFIWVHFENLPVWTIRLSLEFFIQGLTIRRYTQLGIYSSCT